MTVSLNYPITLGERTITELTFPERPKLHHILAGDGYQPQTTAYDLAICESMTGESQSILKQMDFQDWIHVEAMMGKLFSIFTTIDDEEKKSPQETL
ncbi:MAG: hypothetical protein ACRC4W_07180 [Treponemataceae bacterium]